MNEIIEKDIIDIESMIYEIDGKEVMLDTDLSKLYKVETKRINEAVKNNPEKFPLRFSWSLSIEETIKVSRSKISTLNIKQGSNIKCGARVFTDYDRFIIVDRKRVFHSGVSFKDLGKECFAINEIENTKEVDKIMENIKNLI